MNGRLANLAHARGLWYTFRKGRAEFMTTENLSDTQTPTDGAAAKNPAPARGGLWKVGIAAAVAAGLALVFAGGWWLGAKRNTRSSRSAEGDSSSEQDRREAGGSSGLKAGDTKTFTLPGGVEMEMVYVEPGSFTMGSPESEEGHEEDEKQHRVTLTEGFWIGKYPVTQRQWKELVRANVVSFAEGEPTPIFSRDGKGRDRVSGLDTSDFPMENISWDDCKALVDALNKNERGEWHWSFPTEAQWEFAARGGTNSRGYIYSGGNDLDALGWYYENSGLERLSDSDWVRALEKGDFEEIEEKARSNKCRTHSVREKAVGNELGIVGMSGNVLEWCADWGGDYPEGSVTDPKGSAAGVLRLLRGGSWDSLARNCRSASRNWYYPVFRFSYFGFRLCCSAGPRGEAERGGRVTETPPKRSGRRPARAGAHGKVQLWKDGPYWAETNIGAENPEDYGYYFWWGDIVGYKRDGDTWVASDESSQNFSFDEKNTPTFGKSFDKLKSEGWVTEDGVLAPKHDAAQVHWGGDWRMPTDRELRDLKEKCDWTGTTKKGVAGYIVRGKGRYASASIFLPCAGFGDGTSLNLAGSLGPGSLGLYWSSVPESGGNSNNYAWLLYFYYAGGLSTDNNGNRNSGQSVRPVQGFTK